MLNFNLACLILHKCQTIITAEQRESEDNTGMRGVEFSKHFFKTFKSVYKTWASTAVCFADKIFPQNIFEISLCWTEIPLLLEKQANNINIDLYFSGSKTAKLAETLRNNPTWNFNANINSFLIYICFKNWSVTFNVYPSWLLFELQFRPVASGITNCFLYLLLPACSWKNNNIHIKYKSISMKIVSPGIIWTLNEHCK